MRVPAALLFGLAIQACAPVQRTEFRYSTPEGNGPVTLAVVELGPYELVTTLPPPPAPSDGEIDNSDDNYLGGTLWEHREARVLRVLSGPPLARHARVRRLGLDTGPRATTGRLLVFLERTNHGYLFAQWDTRLRHGQACLPQYVIVHFRLEATPSRTNEAGEICFAA